MRTAVVAVGGNALARDPAHPSVPDQADAARTAMRAVASMIAEGWRVVVVHGNGPQIGFVARRVELSAHELHRVPLDVCGADTQGAIGYLFARELTNELERAGIDGGRPVAIVTQVVVDAEDPAFANPTKPIGSFLSADEARRRAEQDGWTVAEDSGRGWRRVVPSPKPIRIVEAGAVEALAAGGYTVVAAGGGGVPVLETAGGLTGVEAVIDKDHAASLLARRLGAELLVIPTAVDSVRLGFGTPGERPIRHASADELRAHLAGGEFGAGSMAPKIEAALGFLADGGARVIITDLASLPAALRGEAGTEATP